MVTMLSLPDPDVFAAFSETVYLCKQLAPREGLVVILDTAIHSVVLMFPEMRVTDNGRITETGKFSLMCHAFLELAPFSNGELFEEDDESLL